MNNKVIATLIASTIITGIIPAQAVIKEHQIITTDSLKETNNINKLSDGTYTIPTKAKNASKPEEDSTADKYMNQISNIYVEDGQMTLELKFTKASVIKEISVKVNETKPENCEIDGIGSDNITLKFNIDSLDQSIVLPMKINPLGFFTVTAEAIIKLDISELKDEYGNLVDLESPPEDDGNLDGDNESENDGTDNGSGDGDTGSDDGSSDEGNNDSTGSSTELSKVLEEGKIYTIEGKALDTSSDNDSAANNFLNNIIELEVENGTTYITLKFNGGTMMNNQKVFINNIETKYDTIKNDSAGNFHMRFPITSLNDSIKLSMYIIPIGNTVSCRLKLDDKTLKDPEGNIVEIGSTGDSGNAPEVDFSLNKKYKAENIVVGSDGNKTPIIANYIQEHSIVEVLDGNLYVYITFVNPNIMSYRELTINGEKANFNSSVNSNGTYTAKIKLNSINDEMEFTNILTRSINDGFKIKVNGNTLQEYKEESNSSSSGNNDDYDESDDEDLEAGTYTIKNKTLKENSDSESVARDYLDTESILEVKSSGKMYLTLKFTKGSLMSNVKVKVEGKTVTPSVIKNSGDKYHIKFLIGSLSDETLISARIMDSMDVKFRVLLRSSTLDEIDEDDNDDEVEEEVIENDDELSGDDNNQIDGSISDNIADESGNESDILEDNNQSYTRITYSINNKIVSDSQIGYQAARDAIDEVSYLEEQNDKLYLTLNLKKTDLMSNIRVIISGNEVKYNTFNKNTADNTMSIKFEIPNENTNITIKSYIGMISRDISFGLDLLEDTKKFIKSEEINASQLEDILGESESSVSTSGSDSSSGSSTTNSSNDMDGISTNSLGTASVGEQLANNALEANEYFKRYTIGNEIISDSTMGRTMARKYLNETSILEEIDGQYYITFTFVGTSAMDNFRFTVNGTEVEYTVVLDDDINGIKSFRFPINSVNDSIQSYIFIKPVKMNIDFGIKLLEDTMVLVEEGTVGDSEDNQDNSSILSDIIDKTTKDSSTGEISAMKIAVSTSALTIFLNQLLGLLSSYLKRKKSIRLLEKAADK